LTKKIQEPLKKIVVGETFLIALSEKGRVFSWGWDQKTGCLGLGRESVDQPLPIPELTDVMDIQMGQDHVVALTKNGEVFCWGSAAKGQLGTKTRNSTPAAATEAVSDMPVRVQGALSDEQIMQIAVVRRSTFALSTSGVVYAWGDNHDNTLGLEEQNKPFVELPTRLTLLGENRIKKLEIFENRTIIAHVRHEDDDMPEVALGKPSDDQEAEIFRGIDEMRKVMEQTQKWWHDLLAIKYGQPYELPQDTALTGGKAKDTFIRSGAIKDDLKVDVDQLERADKLLGALVDNGCKELMRIRDVPGTRNVKFILAMFIDEVRLRREKVNRTLSARRIIDLKKKAGQRSACFVPDFGANPHEEIRKIIAVNRELQQMLEICKHLKPVDVLSAELQTTLWECLECKLELHATRVELLKSAENTPCDPMLPALYVIRDRWNSLRQFSVDSLYMEAEKHAEQFAGNDVEHLKYLVKASNAKIEQLEHIDEDRIISHNALVPSLCYDLLRENANLRKMTNNFQLHVLMIHENKNIMNGFFNDEDGDAGMMYPPQQQNGQGGLANRTRERQRGTLARSPNVSNAGRTQLPAF